MPQPDDLAQAEAILVRELRAAVDRGALGADTGADFTLLVRHVVELLTELSGQSPQDGTAPTPLGGTGGRS